MLAVQPETKNDYAIYDANGGITGGQPAGNSSGNLVTRSGANAISADTISEIIGDTGVTVDGLLLIDSGIGADTLPIGAGNDVNITNPGSQWRC